MWITRSKNERLHTLTRRGPNALPRWTRTRSFRTETERGFFFGGPPRTSAPAPEDWLGFRNWYLRIPTSTNVGTRSQTPRALPGGVWATTAWPREVS